MGCDIHPLTFVNGYNNWRFVAVPPRDRHYAFFGVLAGVRGDLSAVIEPRGYPDWFLATEFGKENLDIPWQYPAVSFDHTPSWLSLADMVKGRFKVWDMTRKPEWGPSVIHAWDGWIELMDFYRRAEDVGEEDVVTVFDFDS